MPISCRSTSSIHGTRNSAEKMARPSATMKVPKVGTDRRMKMYCSDQRMASSSHRPASQDRTPRLDVDALHRVRRIARAGARADRRDRGDLLDLGRGQPDVERGEVLLDALLALGARDRDHVLALRQQPGEDEL